MTNACHVIYALHRIITVHIDNYIGIPWDSFVSDPQPLFSDPQPFSQKHLRCLGPCLVASAAEECGNARRSKRFCGPKMGVDGAVDGRKGRETGGAWV